MIHDNHASNLSGVHCEDSQMNYIANPVCFFSVNIQLHFVPPGIDCDLQGSQDNLTNSKALGL